MSKKIEYKVQDRSILLPYYKRFFVNPTLPYIPRRVNPNSITHAGHLFNLAALVLLLLTWPTKGWILFAAIALVHIYNWCDNADGAHARNTNQCSAMGEFLDHGLDMLNTTYIAFMAAIATGASPHWWVAMALVIPAAASFTYWEQAQTGMFQLGFLNQIESVTLMSLVMLAAAIFGSDQFVRVAIGPLDFRAVLLTFVVSASVVTILSGLRRVALVSGRQSLLTAMPLLAFGTAILCAFLAGALTTVASVVIATAANVFFGFRMLGYRLRGELPRVEASLVLGTLITVAVTAYRVAGGRVDHTAQVIFCVIACIGFGGQALVSAKDGYHRVADHDRQRA